LALPDHLPALRSAGVSCFKIEGRKKSPLYVATTTDYYRKLMDGRLSPEDRPIQEADMQTVFSRPWTRLFVQSHKDKEVADRDTVGHRGTLIGRVEAIRDGRLRFRTARALERHDGLQIDLPILGKPFGFPVDQLRTVTPGKQGKRKETLQAKAGSLVEVALPAEHPDIPIGAPVYCSSSQAVKRRYRHERPKTGQYRSRLPIEVVLECTPEILHATGKFVNVPDLDEPIVVQCTLPGPFPPAHDAEAMEQAAHQAFAKLGQTRLELVDFTFCNPASLFVPVSRLNQLRRDLAAELEARCQAAVQIRVRTLQDELCPGNSSPPPAKSGWSIKVDRLEFLDALEEIDLAGIEEIIVDLARDHFAILHEKLSQWANRLGRERIRVALPPLTRAWEDRGLRYKIQRLRDTGFTRWEAANLSAWAYLDLDPLQPIPGDFDLAADWSLYVLNRLAARQLLQMGVRRFALSPEDGGNNLRSLLSEFADQAVVIVHQDTPQFLAESCAYANLIGGCPGKANCRFESMDMISSHGEKVTALDYHCRTIVLNQGPFCLSPRLKELERMGARHLRADFIYRKYDPVEVRDRWRRLRAGRTIPGGQAANFDRGIL
jgi:putative protease